MEKNNNEGVFFLDGWDGTGQGGYFLRNNLKDFVEKLNQSGKRMIGIKYDGTYNLEIIVEDI